MTDLNQGPARPPSPFRVPPQPLPGQPFNPQQDFFAPAPPPQNSAPPQYSAGPTGALTVESKSPLIALICGILAWLGLWLFTAIPAIIFGVKGRRAAREGRTPNGGMATAGLWLGIANVVLGTLLLIGILSAVAIPVFLNQRAKGIDAGLVKDMKAMATLQDAYIINNPGEMGVAVAATKPGGTVTDPDVAFTASPGNVIAVEIGPDGYCLSGYNTGSRRATSPTASMVYRYGAGVMESAVGAC